MKITTFSLTALILNLFLLDPKVTHSETLKLSSDHLCYDYIQTIDTENFPLFVFNFEGLKNPLRKLKKAINPINGQEVIVLSFSQDDWFKKGPTKAVKCASELAKHKIRRNGETYYPAITVRGYSNGGEAALEFIRRLKSKGIAVDLAVTLDPVPRGPNLVAGIFTLGLFDNISMRAPGKVRDPSTKKEDNEEGYLFYNFYQRDDFIKGHKIRGENVQNFKVNENDIVKKIYKDLLESLMKYNQKVEELHLTDIENEIIRLTDENFKIYDRSRDLKEAKGQKKAVSQSKAFEALRDVMDSRRVLGKKRKETIENVTENQNSDIVSSDSLEVLQSRHKKVRERLSHLYILEFIKVYGPIKEKNINKLAEILVENQGFRTFRSDSSEEDKDRHDGIELFAQEVYVKAFARLSPLRKSWKDPQVPLNEEEIEEAYRKWAKSRLEKLETRSGWGKSSISDSLGFI